VSNNNLQINGDILKPSDPKQLIQINILMF